LRRPARASGAAPAPACLPPRLHKPAGLRCAPAFVLFRPPDIAAQCAGQVPRALTVSLRCFVNRLAAFHCAAPDIATQCTGQVPGAGTLRLRLRVGLPPLASEPLYVSSRPSEPFGLLGKRRNRKAVSPSMFTVADNHKPGYFNQGRMFHCGRAIYRAHLNYRARDGSGYAAKAMP